MQNFKLIGVLTLFVVYCLIGVVHAADPIKIGSPLPMTGPYVADGMSYYEGQQLFVEDINKAGGILGRPLKLVRFDTGEFAPEIVMAAADVLVNKEKVDCIQAGWAGWGQDVRAYGKYDVPTFTWDASMAAVEVFRENPKQYTNWFGMAGPEEEWGVEYFEIMTSLPYEFPNKKIAIITSDDSWGMGIGNGLRKLATEKGWQVVVDEVVPYGTREWRPILSKIRSKKPSYIQLEIMGFAECSTFLTQFKQDPTQSLIHMGYEVAVPDFSANLGDNANGIIGAGLPLMRPKTQNAETIAWMKRFKDRFGHDPIGGSYSQYVTLMMWKNAVEKIGDVKKYKEINKYIAQTPFTEMSGATIYFNEDNYLSNSVTHLPHIQIQNGEIKIIYYGPGEIYMDNKFQVPEWIKN